MKVEIITLFPGYFDSVIRQSIIGRGLEKKLFEIEMINLRDFAPDRHQTVDDKPFGGRGGMVIKAEPLYRCLTSLGYGAGRPDAGRLVLASAAGRKFDQKTAVEYSLCDRLTIICGRYLGVDERILSLFEIDEVSIGDYVLTGGEAAAAVMMESITRLIPGVLGNFESAVADSHAEGLLGPPVYTRPEEFMGMKVPGELLSGDHARVEKFRRRESIRKTLKNRPDLLDSAELDEEDNEILKRLKEENKF